MTQDQNLVEGTARRRLRSLRIARGWSLDELADRSHIGPSTISRIETGQRRITLDHLAALAGALDTTIDDLLVNEEDGEDVVIRPTRGKANGITYWVLSREDDPSGRVVAKMRLPARKRTGVQQVHPGYEWFYVLDGTVRLLLGDREHTIEMGKAARFNTMTPHWMAGYDRPAEILSILSRDGEQAHL